jgi:hypothetical protein
MKKYVQKSAQGVADHCSVEQEHFPRNLSYYPARLSRDNGLVFFMVPGFELRALLGWDSTT